MRRAAVGLLLVLLVLLPTVTYADCWDDLYAWVKQADDNTRAGRRSLYTLAPAWPSLVALNNSVVHEGARLYECRLLRFLAFTLFLEPTIMEHQFKMEAGIPRESDVGNIQRNHLETMNVMVEDTVLSPIGPLPEYKKEDGATVEQIVKAWMDTFPPNGSAPPKEWCLNMLPLALSVREHALQGIADSGTPLSKTHPNWPEYVNGTKVAAALIYAYAAGSSRNRDRHSYLPFTEW